MCWYMHRVTHDDARESRLNSSSPRLAILETIVSEWVNHFLTSHHQVLEKKRKESPSREVPTYAISNAVVVINEIRQKQQQTFFLIPTTASFVPSFFLHLYIFIAHNCYSRRKWWCVCDTRERFLPRMSVCGTRAKCCYIATCPNHKIKTKKHKKRQV